MELRLSLTDVSTVSDSRFPVRKEINWTKLSSAEIDDFRATMEIGLDHIDIPSSIIHGRCLCNEDTHRYDIEIYFSNILNAIARADSVLSRGSKRILKSYWSPELSSLKALSYVHHRSWIENGRPSSGSFYDDYVSSRSNYRRKLRQERRNNEMVNNENLFSSLIDKDTTRFWRTWKSLSQSKAPLTARIDGCTVDTDISDRFSNVFSEIYTVNDVHSHDSLKNEFDSIFPPYFESHMHDDVTHYFFSWQDMLDMVPKLKAGKSYVGLVKAEHILQGSTKLLIHLHILYNAMLQHSFVPTLLLRGNISPLIKDREGDLSDSSNYRAITLSSIFVQIFEMLQKAKFGYFFPNADLQFGFKPKTSTSHAIFSLKQSVDYFSSNRSRVYLAFLDCSKAFDRISHYGLFIKLIKRNIPLCFLLCVMFLYLNMSCSVKWGSSISDPFDIPTGTKQGGILSPDFFALYMHDLIVQLQDSGFGCYIIMMCLACIFFADDIVLLSPSRHGLQKLLDICVNYCQKFCLNFNAKKSKVMIIGKQTGVPTFSPLFLNDTPLEFVAEYRYLGVILRSGKRLTFSATSTIRSFLRAANSILYGRVKPDKTILMKILYAQCVPIITYAGAVKEFNAQEMYRCHVAVNNAIRRIYSFATWQSIRHIRITAGFQSIYEIFASARKKFLFNASNTVVSHLVHALSEDEPE